MRKSEMAHRLATPTRWAISFSAQYTSNAMPSTNSTIAIMGSSSPGHRTSEIECDGDRRHPDYQRVDRSGPIGGAAGGPHPRRDAVDGQQQGPLEVRVGLLDRPPRGQRV